VKAFALPSSAAAYSVDIVLAAVCRDTRVLAINVLSQCSKNTTGACRTWLLRKSNIQCSRHHLPTWNRDNAEVEENLGENITVMAHKVVGEREIGFKVPTFLCGNTPATVG